MFVVVFAVAVVVLGCVVVVVVVVAVVVSVVDRVGSVGVGACVGGVGSVWCCAVVLVFVL